MTSQQESPYAWARLGAALALMTLGGSGMYSISVALAPVQAEFGITRGGASLPYTLTMIGFGVGGILMGRLADRFGVMAVVMIGAVGLGAGYIAAGMAPGPVLFGLAQGVLVGLLGTSASFAPLVADTTRWFDRRRGIALAICMSGNYTAGAVWPPVMQFFIDSVGWRQTYVGIGVFCLLSIVPLALVLRRRPPPQNPVPQRMGHAGIAGFARPMGLSPNAAQALLCVVARRAALRHDDDLSQGADDRAGPLVHELADGAVEQLVLLGPRLEHVVVDVAHRHRGQDRRGGPAIGPRTPLDQQCPAGVGVQRPGGREDLGTVDVRKSVVDQNDGDPLSRVVCAL